jgi:phage/plasmid-associated DNA primase
MMDLASPMSAFVRDCCKRAPDAEVYRDDLYQAWHAWADDNGHHAGAKSTFGRDLRAVVPELRDFKRRSGDHLFPYYANIALLRASPASPTAESGWPASDGALKPQVRGTEAGEAGKTPFKSRNSAEAGTEAGKTGGQPPCPGCGMFYVNAGYHRGDCTANKQQDGVK